MLSSAKKEKIFKKTNHKCSICGKTHDLTCDHFIPKWTGVVGNHKENLVPMCKTCNHDKGWGFISIDDLIYLPETEKEVTITFYREVMHELRPAIKRRIQKRTCGTITYQRAFGFLQGYDIWFKNKKNQISKSYSVL